MSTKKFISLLCISLGKSSNDEEKLKNKQIDLTLAKDIEGPYRSLYHNRVTLR